MFLFVAVPPVKTTIAIPMEGSLSAATREMAETEMRNQFPGWNLKFREVVDDHPIRVDVNPDRRFIGG